MPRFKREYESPAEVTETPAAEPVAPEQPEMGNAPPEDPMAYYRACGRPAEVVLGEAWVACLGLPGYDREAVGKPCFAIEGHQVGGGARRRHAKRPQPPQPSASRTDATDGLVTAMRAAPARTGGRPLGTAGAVWRPPSVPSWAPAWPKTWRCQPPLDVRFLACRPQSNSSASAQGIGSHRGR